jgi:hypothetical protein
MGPLNSFGQVQKTAAGLATRRNIGCSKVTVMLHPGKNFLFSQLYTVFTLPQHNGMS